MTAHGSQCDYNFEFLDQDCTCGAARPKALYYDELVIKAARDRIARDEALIASLVALPSPTPAQEVEGLREALEPFAVIANAYAPSANMKAEMHLETRGELDPRRSRLRLEHFFAALAALRPADKRDGGE